MSAKTNDQDDTKTPSADSTMMHPSQNPSNSNNNSHDDFLYQLRLPRMNENETPSLRILVVSDIDLTSASALAEHAHSVPHQLGGGLVDCIIACGPLVNYQAYISRYLQGRNRRQRQQENSTLEYSPETTAALEGLASATLAQLESIVCRIVYIPHPSDPSTLLRNGGDNCIRLTPNSVNVHETWLSLAPGIGCCGYAGISETQRQGLVGVERTRVQHGLEYEEALQKVLEQAPSSSLPTLSQQDCNNTITFASDKMQAILITQVGTDKNTSPKASRDNDTFDWPKHHLHFMDSSLTQEGVLLNVASAPSSCPPFQQARGKTRLVSPGSLRQHGDYCLVTVGVHAENETSEGNAQTFSWKVDEVVFRNMKHTSSDNDSSKAV